ncbi:(2Fe-2S) ferredoxin domain-containing protein [Mycolicibacterium vaccae]|uniref:(2Fe-2S) ferredoxin domain-containing protein n=1 Tax=Mycolicibacterium vaccae TaxID=1810 RepID=UPI003CEBA9A3
MTDHARHVVLVGMGVDAHTRDTDSALLAEHVGARLAYLQLGSPTLLEVLDDIAAAAPGSTVRLLPLPAGGAPAPARSWLRRIAGDWVRRNPGALSVEVASGAVTGWESGLSSPAWEDVPSYGRHVLVCRGPRCTAKGSVATAQAIADRLRAHGLGDDEVLVAQTGCLYPCNHAPVVAVHPDDDWWGPVTPDDAETLVATWASSPRGAEHRRSVQAPPRA